MQRVGLVVTLSLFAAVPQDPTPAFWAALQKEAAVAPLVVAHRGASEQQPENTAGALQAAAAAGAQIVEFDVHQTKDGAFVVLHDATLDRTTDAVARLGRRDVKVAELTLAEVQGLDAGAWRGSRFAGAKVPTLAAALLAIGDAVPMLEHKAGDPAALAAELRRLGRLESLLVQSFDWDWLARFRAAAPRTVLGALGSKALTDAQRQQLQRLGVQFVHWDHRALTVADVAGLRAAGYLCGVYTVDPDALLLGAAALGCDFVTTNRPERLMVLRTAGTLAAVRRAAAPTR